MSTFELSNNQRTFLGLDPIEKHWDKVAFIDSTGRPDSVLYYDGDIIKRHIISIDSWYSEKQYNEPTKDRSVLLPKTSKGKEKKLTASVLEQRQPTGVYVNITDSGLSIGNYTTQTTFYSSGYGMGEQLTMSIPMRVAKFVEESSAGHLEEINEFKNAKRKHIKFKAGDYFCFKLDRTHFGFGRILLDVNKLRKKGFLKEDHGLKLLMGPPLIVQLFAHKSLIKTIDISQLDNCSTLPSDVMMDNLLLYGEFEIIGHRSLNDEEFDFPVSYGGNIGGKNVVFLQWGFIHLELPKKVFSNYLTGDKAFFGNPYGYYSIGILPHYFISEILEAIDNNGDYNFSNKRYYGSKWDLRNPSNREIKNELFKVFGLDPTKSYSENCKLTNTMLTTDLIKQL
jgi:hypothetical protein